MAMRVFSGIQPTGVPQLGNYLGSLQNWVKLQQNSTADDSLLFSIVDLHALTVPRSPQKLRQETLEMAASIVACGVDPSKSLLFRQSAVAAHTQLLWVLGCITPVGWLNRMTQWKSKLQQQGQLVGQTEALNVHAPAAQGLLAGLFTYPVLMAADILLYKATHIPVGDDQVQHLELARDIAEHFNKTYKTRLFPLPAPLLTESKRVMSLRDPQRKMSKSDPNEQRRLTRSAGSRSMRKERPGVANLLAIYAALRETECEQAAAELRDCSNAQLKEAVAEAVVQFVGPVRSEMQRLLANAGDLEKMLAENEEKVNGIARANWKEIATCVGLQ
ncbi:tryptophanyl-tRNA synthetase [Linderina pennispora]|uniref:tryptophan--tRNA ligase n=1 Tax=Linderina pennispora TaxID=61395 RepID=A0A1Y1W681_9FUNG|nr:tryptophanyl-tRNA synthetase [Linderina pennispora]ORX69039.1 tryptophanyl-tRNA synthetase [Linderina pennispora]